MWIKRAADVRPGMVRSGLLRRAVPWKRIMHGSAAAICLLMACSEWRLLGFAGLQWQGMLVSVMYLLALVALPVRPVPASVMIVIVTLAEVMLPPDIRFVQSMWGLCYALIVLAMDRRTMVSVASIVVMAALSFVQGDESLLLVIHPSFMTMLPFLVVACAIGCCLRLWVDEVRRREQVEAARAIAEQRNEWYRERLDLLHELHESVAGALTYAVLLCRDMRRDCGAASESADMSVDGIDALRRDSERVEAAVAQSLTSLRNEVIGPVRRKVVDSDLGAVDGDCGVMPKRETMADGRHVRIAVERHARRAAVRLETMGIRCDVLVLGDAPALDRDCLTLTERVIDEFGSNMLKYGRDGDCALVVTLDAQSEVASMPLPDGSNCHAARTHAFIRVWSSNACDRSIEHDPALTGATGLALLRRDLAGCGGTLKAANDDGVWTAVAMVPVKADGRRR